MKNLGLIGLLLMLLASVYAQEPSAFISSKDVRVGETVYLQYEIQLSVSQTFEFNPPVGTFPCNRISEHSSLKGTTFNDLEILKYHDTIIKKGAKHLWRGEFQLVPWDSGTLVLQALPYTLDEQQFYLTSVIIESKLVDAKKGLRIYDIKEGFNPIKKDFVFVEVLTDYSWIIIVIVVVLVAYWFYKRSRKPKEIPSIPLSLKEQTLQSIKKLSQKQQWVTDQKLHYTELSFILRWYLSARYQINLLERTSGETILLLKAMKIDAYQIELISSLLLEADTVKFAKNTIALSAHEQLIDQLKEIVIISSPIDLANV